MREFHGHIPANAFTAADLGIPALAIFPNISPKDKSEDAAEAANPKGLVPEAVRAIKKAVPNIGVIVDVALDPYTSHGHDGLMEGETILNDPTVMRRNSPLAFTALTATPLAHRRR